MLISWLMLGKPYPVTEKPIPGDPKSLLGKGCMKGFDSHYVITNKSTGYPCAYNIKPDYDEIVLFSKNQILPRYLVYYKATNSTNMDEYKLKYREAKCMVLWVDDKISFENREIVKLLQKRPKKTEVLVMKSSSEILAWLHKFRGFYTNRLCIITNTYRKGDGDDLAAEILVKSIRQNKKWTKIPIVVFCNNTSNVLYLRKTYKNITITNEVQDILKIDHS
mmetsp:Transcript_6141/g.6698  ORF Transcript_6141/g.6698 Transcript_6141/m.6698 type:complete len:221 (+) Transcript_6141:59-721(+)